MTDPGQSDMAIGDRVLIEYAATEPATAKIAGFDPRRPNVVKVIYEHSRTGAWVARRRIIGRAP